jgi:cell division septation protein DedD
VSEGLAKRVAGTLVLGVIGLIVLPLLIDFTDPNKVDRTTKIPAAPSIEAVSLERAKRPESVNADFNVKKSLPVVTKPKAKKLLKKLADQGYKAFIERAVITGENHYRVVVGPKIDWRRAKAASQAIDRIFETKSIILKYET